MPTDPALLAERKRTVAAHMAGDLAAARKLYGAYLARCPGDQTMWSNLGALLRREGMHAMAVHAQRRAHAIAPDTRAVRNNLANILADTGAAQEALALRMQLIEEEPDDAGLAAMIGKTLRTLGRTSEAVEHLERACAAHPEDAELVIQLALSLLSHGEYARGFAMFEARWLTGELTARQVARPKWGGGSLAGQRILVLPEQGFGDTIAFARFLPVLRRFGPARVTLAVERPLRRLFGGIAGVDATDGDPADTDAFDVWTNVMDLPTVHFASGADVPAPARLTVPQAATDRARAMMAPHRDRFRVGVVWTGSQTYRGNAFRSFGHDRFAGLIDVADLQMVSLYKGPRLAEFHADGTAQFILDAGASEADFADNAAMMREMDLVVTSDTATAHLAGSLGVPVWTLLHWDAFWLWQRGDATPWYPSMRLIRQAVPGDWDDVFARVRAGIESEIATWRARRCAS